MRNTPTCVGKTVQTSGTTRRAQETPPRAWGRRIERSSVAFGLRNTPTCVGKTASQEARCLHRLETPPRAWGRRERREYRGDESGNTPTCVGKTQGGRYIPTAAKKHPHVRGEDLPGMRRADTLRETPPRAWGRRTVFLLVASLRGNTPTCVGKTSCSGALASPFRKHPHVRGEDAITQEHRYEPLETPPRAWGRHAAHVGSFPIKRNTPTCVGKTALPAHPLPRPRKHPHVRGEDFDEDAADIPAEETPPRAWGRPGMPWLKRKLVRNTPTCVGKTEPCA